MKISFLTKIYVLIEILKFLPKVRGDKALVINTRNFFITDIAFTFKKTVVK